MSTSSHDEAVKKAAGVIPRRTTLIYDYQVLAVAENVLDAIGYDALVAERDDWRRNALTLRRIVKALPGCLTPTAVTDIEHHLACEITDDEALAEFRELIPLKCSEPEDSEQPRQAADR